jgi:nucleoid-associated protein YgaU
MFREPSAVAATLASSPTEPPTAAAHMPPQITSHYRPMLPFRVTEESADSRGVFVPVEPRPADGTSDHLPMIEHTVAPGETLYSIARRYYGRPDAYLELYRINRDVLTSPIALPAGVKIRVPQLNSDPSQMSPDGY